MKDKALEVGQNVVTAIRKIIDVTWFVCAVYGAYQIITKFPQLGQVLEIAQK